jgi:hypothetical protein
MRLVQVTEGMIINVEDIIATYRTDDGAVRLLMRYTIREIEISSPSAENAWNLLLQCCTSEQAQP